MSDNSQLAAEPDHPFAPFIKILGKGKSGSRSLSQNEAREAFDMVLLGKAEPLQVGAFLMLLRVKEETPEELAGFVEACRNNAVAPPPQLVADLDWSSYAGKKHQHPWYLLSMLLLAEAGHRVFVHGSAGHTPGRLYTETALQELGIELASNWDDVSRQLDKNNFSYLPLQCFCLPLQGLIQLRPLLGLRSPVNTLTRMLNPLRANVSVQSIFHPAYARLHQHADRLLQQPRALVFKGESGEVEIKPQADTRAQLLTGDIIQEMTFSRSVAGRVADVDIPNIRTVRALWRGEQDNHYGLEAVLSTTAAALLALTPGLDWDQAHKLATDQWHQRNRRKLD